MSFYNWETADDGFRVLNIPAVEQFVKESESFSEWSDEFRECSCCYTKYPESEYFFKLKGSRGLSRKCKVCDGYKFAWGKRKKEELISSERKYCQKCDTVYPLNDMYFARSKDGQAGYASYCKMCVSGCEFGINKRINNVVFDKLDGYKICTGCYKELPLTDEYYFKSNHTSDGYEPKCKGCNGCEYGVMYLNKVYQYSLPDGYKYCYICREILSVDEFYCNSKMSDGKDIKCKNCASIVSHSRRHGDSSSKEYTTADWMETIQHWSTDYGCECAYCGEITESPTMEHVVPFSKGGELSKRNIIPVCKRCNSSKRDKSIDEFYMLRNYFTKDRYDKILEFIRW